MADQNLTPAASPAASTGRTKGTKGTKGDSRIKSSAVDTLQLRGVDTQRFVQRVGKVSPTALKSITAAIAAVIEY